MRRTFILIAVLSVILAIYFVLTCYNRINSYYSGMNFSSSIAEAKNRKVFISTVNISPKELNLGGVKIRFGEAWIEKQISYKPESLVFKKYEDTGKYWLRFNLINSLPNGDWFFVVENENGSVSQNSDKVFSKILDSIPLRNFKVNLINNWKQKRNNEILFDVKGN